MSFESVLRDDILSPDLVKPQSSVKIIAETQFTHFVNSATRYEKLKTPEPAKNIDEAMRLIGQAIDDYFVREHATEDAKVVYLYEEPDKTSQLEAITAKLVRREPGAFGKGAPFESNIRQLRPILRELLDDPEHPGYKRAILGQWHDNMVRLTCWARTNKQANCRALWLENVMEEYAWFFAYSGVARVLYQGRSEEVTHVVENNKIYGRPIDYFIKTEQLRNLSQKKLEEICIRFNLGRINLG